MASKEAHMDRPMVNVYEPDAEGVEKLVYRPMNDEEYAEHKARVEAAANRPEPEHPVITAVRNMSDKDKAVLKELLL